MVQAVLTIPNWVRTLDIPCKTVSFVKLKNVAADTLPSNLNTSSQRAVTNTHRSPLDKFDGFKRFVHVAYSEIVTKIDHRI